MGLLGDYLPDYLPEDADKREAAKLGLLNLGASMLANSRQGFGGALGNGLLAGTQTYGAARDDALKRRIGGMQYDQLKLQTDEARRNALTNEQIMQAGKDSTLSPEQMAMANGQGPTVANAGRISTTAPGFDTQGFLNRVMGVDPLKGMALRGSMAKESPFGKIDPDKFTPESVAKFAQTQNYGDLQPARKMEIAPNGQVYNPYAIQPGRVLADPNKPFSVGADGAFVPNVPYQNYEISKSKAGATNVNIKNDVKTGESLANQIGPMMKDSATAATGAVQQVDAAQRIVKAIDSNNVFAGPGATTKLKIAQMSDALEIGGKDTAEKIANTRQTIRGLAELTLQGRKQMTGQGAITESEGALAEKAMSGNIDDLSPAEIKMLAQASERAARFVYAEHQRKIQQMRSTKGLEGITPFYETAPMLPPYQPAKSAAPKSGGITFLGFEGQ